MLPRLAALALVLATGALAADPPQVTPRAKERFDAAQAAAARMEWAPAFQAYLEAQAADPQVLGLDDHGLLGAVEGWLLKAVDDKPDDHEAHYKLGRLRALQGMLEDAVTEYREVVRLAPRSQLAGVVRPWIADLEARIAAAAAARPPPPPPPSEPAGPTVEELKAKVETLESELAAAQAKITMLENANAGTSYLTQELDRVNGELADLRKKSEEWRIFHTLYFADLEKARRAARQNPTPAPSPTGR